MRGFVAAGLLLLSGLSFAQTPRPLICTDPTVVSRPGCPGTVIADAPAVTDKLLRCPDASREGIMGTLNCANAGWVTWGAALDTDLLSACHATTPSGQPCAREQVGFSRKFNFGSAPPPPPPPPTGSGEVFLNWTDPVTWDDGTPLTTLASIRIHRSSTSGGPYTQIAEVAAGVGMFGEVGLADGDYYYVATAVDSSGFESIPSNEAFKQIRNGVDISPAAPILLGGTLICQPTGAPRELLCFVP